MNITRTNWSCDKCGALLEAEGTVMPSLWAEVSLKIVMLPNTFSKTKVYHVCKQCLGERSRMDEYVKPIFSWLYFKNWCRKRKKDGDRDPI